RAEGGLDPLRPFVQRGPLQRIGGPESLVPVTRAEIAHDRRAFPEMNVVVAQHRHEAVRVHGTEFRRIEAAEPAAGIDALAFQPDLGQRPHDNLYIGRRGAAPYGDHLILLADSVCSLPAPSGPC